MIKFMKSKLIIILFISFFLLSINVSAGVCEGKSTDSEGYCTISNSYRYSYRFGTSNTSNPYYRRICEKNSWGECIQNIWGDISYNYYKGWISYPFNIAASTSFSNKTEYAFCLDPGKYNPSNYSSGSYNKFRELDLSSLIDQNFYKVYNYYVNAYAANKSNQNKYLADTDVFVKTFCLTSECKQPISNTMYTDYLKIAPYISGGSSLSGLNKGYVYWGLKSDIDNLRNYFISNIKNRNYWKNPLSIETNNEYDEEKDVYRYTFKVKFTNSTSKYFNNSDVAKLNGDYDIGNGNAYFNYEILINNGAIQADKYIKSGKSLDNITKATSNANSDINIVFEFTTDEYKELVNTYNDLTIKMDYRTYHPMSVDNLFIHKSGNSNAQRMLVFSHYEKIDSVTIGENRRVSCTQTRDEETGVDIFNYGEKRVTLNEYIRTGMCGCDYVNYDELSTDSLKDIYIQECGSKEEVKYESTLDSCETDLGMTNYVKRDTTKILNRYCKVDCNETITIDNLIDKNNASYKALKSGEIFSLYQYPKLKAEKTCDVSVYYENFLEDYTDDLVVLVNRYNEYAQASSITTSNGGCCDEEVRYGEFGSWTVCVKDWTVYNYNYNKIEMSGTTLDVENSSGEYGRTCYGSIDYQLPTKRNRFLNTSILLSNNLRSLYNCNDYLDSLGRNKDHATYYPFLQELNYYYEQTLSKDHEIVRNDERQSYYAVDDSLFKSIETSPEDKDSNISTDYIIPNEKEYNYIIGLLSEGGTNLDEYRNIRTEQVGVEHDSDYIINRYYYYQYEYEPSKIKYVNAYTGKILLEENASKTAYLGNVYDIDASAIAKDNNVNYYHFSQLGENNYIFDYYNQNEREDYVDPLNNRSYEKTKVDRYCTYEIYNDLLKTDEEASIDSKMNTVFRIVDSNNIDPNGRLSDEYNGTNGFKNWRNELGEKVKDEIEDNDTFNPGNIEYSFELDSKTIKDIREHNSSTNYGDFNLDCEEGNKCESYFVSKYAITDDFGNIAGRSDENWKELGGE